jgi:hypothetical protein
MAGARTITLLLRDVAGGDKEAVDRLMPLVHDALRQIAGGHRRPAAHAEIRRSLSEPRL